VCIRVCIWLLFTEQSICYNFSFQKSGDQGYEDLFEDFSPDHSPTFDYFDDLGPSMSKKVRIKLTELAYFVEVMLG